MKTVTINNEWRKLSDITDNDSVILVNSEDGISITDNISAGTIKFSLYKNMESFTVKKKNPFWIKSNNANSILKIFEIKTENPVSSGGNGGFPAGDTKYQNIYEIENDINNISDELESKSADLGILGVEFRDIKEITDGMNRRIEILNDPYTKYREIHSINLDYRIGTPNIISTLTQAFYFIRKGSCVAVSGLNGFSFLSDPLPDAMLELTPLSISNTLILKLNFQFPASYYYNITNAVIHVPVNELWVPLDPEFDFYNLSNWKFYGGEEILLNNVNISKFLLPNPNMSSQTFTSQELALNTNEVSKVFKEIHIYYTLNNNFGGGKFVITKFSTINSAFPEDSCTFTNYSKQPGTLLLYGAFPESPVSQVLKVTLPFPSALTGDTTFSIKKIVGKYY